MKQDNIQKGFAQADSVDIAYQVSGEGPPLICGHAMGWDHSIWDEHRQRLSQHFRVITFDQRGSGESDHPPFTGSKECAYSIDHFGEDLAAVLDKLNITRANVLGYSMGAISALSFATRWPERINRLILVSAMASRLPEEIIERAKIVEQILDEHGLEETYKFYFAGSMFEGEANSPFFKEKIASVIAKASPHGFRGCFRVTIDRPSMIEQLRKISAPSLIIVGARDKHYVIESERLLEHLVDAKRVIINNAGHALTAQSPQEFENAVLEFLCH